MFRHRCPAEEMHGGEPSSRVHLLTTEDEVRIATLRAVRFAEVAAALAEARTRGSAPSSQV